MPNEAEKPALSEADRAAIAQRMVDGASLEAAISAVRPDKTDVTYPDLPYVAWMDHDGDFSWNSNNYVHGPMARIKPRK